MWRKYFKTTVAVDGRDLFARYGTEYDRPCFSVLASEDKRAAAIKLRSYCENSGEPLRLCNITEDELPEYTGIFPELRPVTDRGWSDYLYDADSLKTFPGKKLHTHKNHLNRFVSLCPDAHFEEITPGNLGLIYDFLKRERQKKEPLSGSLLAEAEGIDEILGNFSAYRLLGGMMISDGKPVAFSLGDIVGDTLFVHIEKADTDIPGSFQAMVSGFASHFAIGNIRFINREDDMGDEGLRHSKLSYRPIGLINKYMLE